MLLCMEFPKELDCQIDDYQCKDLVKEFQIKRAERFAQPGGPFPVHKIMDDAVSPEISCHAFGKKIIQGN